MKSAYEGIDDLQLSAFLERLELQSPSAPHFYTNIEIEGDRASVILRDALNPGNVVGRLDGPKASVRAALNDWADQRISRGNLTFRFWEHDLR